jgi:signal transduction histidine kinase
VGVQHRLERDAPGGPGIAPEHRDRVFERFYRVDHVQTTGRGAGLGLAIVQWAVEANGGRIELETQVGQGSVFRVVLPTAKGERQ